MDERATQPNWVQCKPCGHRWIGFYLPQPIDDAVKILKNLRCPKCTADSNDIFVFDGSAHSNETGD